MPSDCFPNSHGINIHWFTEAFKLVEAWWGRVCMNPQIPVWCPITWHNLCSYNITSFLILDPTFSCIPLRSYNDQLLCNILSQGYWSRITPTHTHTLHTHTHTAHTHTNTHIHAHTHTTQTHTTHTHTHSEANNLLCMVLYARSEGPTVTSVIYKICNWLIGLKICSLIPNFPSTWKNWRGAIFIA